MKSVNTVRTSTVMVARWSRLKSRIVSMYSRIWTVIAPMLFMLVLGGWSSDVLGANCNYNTATITTSSKNTVKNGDTYKFFGTRYYYDVPSFEFGNVTNNYGISHVKLSLKFSGLHAVTEKFNLAYKINNGSWSVIPNSEVTVGVTSKDIDVDVSIDGASGQKVYFQLQRVEKAKFTDEQTLYVSNLEVRMKSTISANVSSINFGNVTYGNNKSEDVTAYYTLNYSGDMTATCTGDFSATLGASCGCSTALQTKTVTVKFTPTQAGTRTGTLTIKNPDGTKTTVSLTGTGVRANPTLKMNNSSVNVTTDQANPVTLNLANLKASGTTSGIGDFDHFEVRSADAGTGAKIEGVTINGNNFSSIVGGTYTVRAITKQNNQYSSTYKDFTVTVNRLTQTISWSTDESVFVEEDVISATSIGEVTLTKSGTGVEYVTIEGNTATVSEVENNSSVTLTATAAQTDVYAQATDSKTITLTSLQKQHITFDQNLTKLKTTDGTKKVELVATSDSGRDSYITFAVDANTAGVSVTQEGGKWYLNYTAAAVKGIAVTASLAGVEGVSIAASDVSQMVKVTDPTDKCHINEPLATASGLANTSKTYNLTIPKQVVLKVRSSKSRLYTNNYQISFYNAQGQQVGNTSSYTGNSFNTNTDTRTFSDLDKSITKMVFKSNASNGFDITEASYTRWSYANPSVNRLDFEALALSTVADQTFTLDYANYQVELSIEGSSNFVLKSDDFFGDCETYGTETIKIGYNVPAEATEETAFLYVRDNTGTELAKITLHAIVQGGLTQNITSHNIGTAYKTTDLVNLTATTDRGLTNFSYSATPAGVANFDGAQMTFSKSGTIAITVTEAGNGAYAEASATVNNVVVSKVTPTIATNPTVAEIKYKGSFANSQLSNGLATVTLRGMENTPVAGTFTWTSLNGTTVNDAQGSHDYSVTFTPTDGGMYNPTTFTQSVTISRADGGIVMNNGEVKVKVAGINDNLDECKIDLDGLVKSKIEDGNRAGGISFAFKSSGTKSVENAEIDANNVFTATAVGTYTIVATQAQTDYYEEATDEFTVTVNKLTPTIVFDNTDNPEIIYSGDVIEKPAYRMYNGKEIDRVVNYVSSDPSLTGAIHVEGTKLTARDVPAPEGSAVEVTITASTEEDDFYTAASEETTHDYAVRAMRSPHFTMDGQVDTPVSKTLNIGETATITYNENTDESFTIGKATEYDYISYSHNPETRTITVMAVKGALASDGEQTITLNQPGTSRLFPRNVVYTFTVRKNVSTLSLDGLTTAMNVEDTVATPYAGLANTTENVQFSCSPEGSMKYEDGKLIALAAGTNTVTFYQPATEYWTGISQSKTITVSRKDPGVTTELANRHAWYSIIEHPFKSLNTEKEFTIESSNESLAKYIKEEDKIYVYGTSGNVTFTVNQEANYKYNAVENYQKTFTIFQPNNRLPFTLTSGNLEDYNGGSKGGVSWNGNGVVVGSSSLLSKATDWSAKYIILKFVGVPDKLSFDFENTISIATQYGWHFYQSSNGKDWNLIKEYQDALANSTGGTSEGSEKNIQLDPATQYIKLEYHGNYGGRFKNVHVTERKEIAPRDATKDFGLGYNGNEPTMRAITVDWYNVQPCTVTITGTDADKFVLDEGNKTINSQLDHYGTVDLKVSYKHETNSETMHTATLHIEDADGKYADVTLNGQTTPAPQTIIWRSDLTPMPIEGSFQNAAMVTTGQAVTLVSDHPEIVRVVNNTTLEPVSAGTAHVTATAAGNTKWAETTDFMDIEVTTLKVQYITWTDNLSNRKREEGQTVEIELTATSSAGLPITYELDKDAQAFASINGNVLSLTGWGNGQVIAKQVGTEEYVAVQATKGLVSRNPNAKCRPLVGEYKDEYTLHTLAVKEIPIYGEADSVTFWAKCDASALWGMWVAEEYDGSYHDVQEISRLGDPNITSNYQRYSFPLHRNATAVKLYTKTGATMTRTFKEVEVVLAKYLELAENTMNFSQVDKGSTKTQSFYINYSNLSGVLDVEMENKENTQFTVLTPTVGEDCGDIGKSVRIEISCTGSTLGTENNKIIISNKDQSLSIPVSATVVLPSQTITWEPAVNVLTTDEVVLSATATSELPVSFTSGNTDIADVVYEGGVYSLDIKSYGDVEITAHQAGNEDWSAATDKTLTYHISRVTPVVTTWPTAQVILPNTVGNATIIGGVAPEGIEGSFKWEDGSQTVTFEAHTFNVLFEPSNKNYYETVSHALEIEILKTPQTITWDRANETEEWCASVIALDATTDSNLDITYHSSDSTIAYAEDGKLKVLQFGEVTITAEQKGNETYAAAQSVTKTITLKRNKLTLPEFDVMPVYVHHFLSSSTFPTVYALAGNVEVGGTFQWMTPNMLMDNPGMNNCTAVFTPNNVNWYEPKECVLSVEVLRFAPTITHNFTTEAANYGVKISELVLNGSGTAVDGYDPEHASIEGTFEWKTPNHVPVVSETSAILVFRPTRSEWYDEVELPIAITINSVGYIFTGDGAWGSNSNWAEGYVPGKDEDVVIQGNVVISSEVEVDNLTIEGGSSVTLTVNGKLTVNGESAGRDLYGDVHVCNNGQLILAEEASLQVRNFTLDAKLGDNTDAHPAASGQVDGTNKLKVNGTAYFDLQLDPDTRATYGWYTFTVPFEVNVAGGIYRLNNDGSMTLYQAGRDFIIARYDEAKRARGEKGWVKVNSGVLQAGIAYNISVDDEVEQNVLRFVWNKHNDLGASYSCPLQLSESTTDKAGWNGLGNGTLTHTQLNGLDDEAKVQMYDHGSNSFVGVYAKNFTYAVGTAFFYQAENTDPLILSQADGSRVLRAPKREIQHISEFQLSLTDEEKGLKTDMLYVSADEDASGSYKVGRDLLKMSNPSEAKVAQMWSTSKGLTLCDIEMPLVNNEANCTLSLFAPKAGSYELKIERAPEDAELYLTYNDNIIWDLTASPYVFDLTKGTTNGYGLRIEAKRGPQVWTGIDSMEADGQTMRKVLIDNKVYVITPEGKMYDIMGKSVKY